MSVMRLWPCEHSVHVYGPAALLLVDMDIGAKAGQHDVDLLGAAWTREAHHDATLLWVISASTRAAWQTSDAAQQDLAGVAT